MSMPKKPFDCSEEELIQLYGDPMDPQDIRTPDDLDRFYRNRCYVRFLYKPMLLWASKDKMAGADKRTCGIKYIIYHFFINIVIVPFTSPLIFTAILIERALKLERKSIDFRDLAIAATAFHVKEPFATMNAKHFINIDGLQLISPPVNE